MTRTSSICQTSVVLLATLIVTLGPMPAGIARGQADDTWDILTREFREPPLRRKSRPLWFWNARPTAEETAGQMEKLREIGYAGVAILPGGGKGNRGPELPFMSPEYLKQYKVAADTAKRLGMKMCLYDEYWFPSGYAGGLLAKRYPEALSKRLDRTVFSAKGPGRFERKFEMPDDARLMGIVAVRDEGKQRIDVSSRLSGGVFRWDVPEGDWRIQAFVCVRDGARGMVDYLEPESVNKFYELTYEAYRGAMPEHFGTTIDSAFYDEPTFHWISGGRAWTPRFNEYFQQRFGFSPVPLYPALWEDIGPDTAAARNALFGFRATLFSEGFVKTIAEQLAKHGVPLTGHVDQEEIVNPVGLCGDLMKSFEYQPIPGLDQVFKYGRGSRMYKIISSAAYNYDRPLVMTEVYGGEGRIPIDMLYREAMDQAAKGVNLFVPHAVWYDPAPEQVNYQPELSHRDPLYGKALPKYNEFIGRLHGLLQPPGRHVADIAVLYPIASLQAGYHFDGPLKPYVGGVVPKEADYMDLGERLALDLHRDYTFLHPDVLRDKCRVEANQIVLNNRTNCERFTVLILPGMQAIRVETLRKLADFYRHGGRIIATTRLADQAAEFHKNHEVRRLISEIFGPCEEGPEDTRPRILAENSHASGGRAWFLSRPDPALLADVLRHAQQVFDVEFNPEPNTSSTTGNFTYLHRVLKGRHVWFFANSSDRPIETTIRLRGQFNDLQWWDPHKGDMRAASATETIRGGVKVTTARLHLPQVRSVFLVGRESPP